MKEKNIRELEILVKQNNSEAIYELGERYYFGKGVEIDYEKAKMYYAKAEYLGNYKGKYAIGRMYYFGKSFEKNYERAYNIFNELTIKYDDQYSKYYLGEMYYFGKYVEKNYEKAYNIFNELATKYNDDWAKYYLGEMYYFGKYVGKDYGKAYDLFNELATEYNDDWAKYYLGEMYYFGKYVGKDYEQAKILFEQVKNGYDKVNAEYYLGKIFENGGYGVTQNFEKAEEYFRKIEKDICTTLICYVLGIEYLAKFSLSDIVNRDMVTVKECMSSFDSPKHSANVYYKRWKNISEDAYNDIIERLKVKISKYNGYLEKAFTLITNEEILELIVDCIVDADNDSEVEEVKQELNKLIEEFNSTE